MRRTECGILFSYGTTTLFYDDFCVCDFDTSSQYRTLAFLTFTMSDYHVSTGILRERWTEHPKVGSGVRPRLAPGGYGFIGQYGYYEFHSFEGTRWVICDQGTSRPDIYNVFITEKQWSRLKQMLTVPKDICV